MSEAVEAVPAPGNTEGAAEVPVLTPGGTGAETNTEAAGAEAPVLNPGEGATPPEGGATPPKQEENADIGAPETYGDFKLPDGFSLDDADRERVSTLFKGLNLSQQGGQKLIDAFTERMTAQKEADLRALADRRRSWREEIRKRPDYAADRALAQKGLNAVVTSPEEVELFKNSWMSDHPALFSIFVKVGRLVGEDSPLSGGQSTAPVDSAVVRFPVKR